MAEMQMSLKRNFVWAFIGNASYALCGYLLLTILTKTSSVATVGLWGIAQAVTLPVATFFSLNLVAVNITDVRNEYKTGHYVALRLLASLMTVFVATTIGFIFYPVSVAVIVGMMSISQAIIDMRLYLISNMQKFEQLKLSTISQIFEGLLTLLLFGLLFWYTRSLLMAIMGTIVSRLSVLLTYDLPVSLKVLRKYGSDNPADYTPLWQWSSIWNLVKLAAPLAVVAGIGSVFQNIPRVVIEKTHGREELGYFTAMAMLLVALTMVNQALGNTTLPRLSKYFVENKKAFMWLFIRLIGLNLCLGTAFVAIAFFFGESVLTVLFTAEYARHNNVFVILAISGCVLSIFAVSNSALNATRQFAVQVPIYVGTAVISGIFSLLLIPKYGIMGGAFVLVINYLFGTTMCLFFVIRAIRRKNDNAGQS